MPDAARSEDNIEFAGGDDRIFTEGFVEIAETEEENRVGVLGFYIKVLLADGGVFFLCHGDNFSMFLRVIVFNANDAN